MSDDREPPEPPPPDAADASAEDASASGRTRDEGDASAHGGAEEQAAGAEGGAVDEGDDADGGEAAEDDAAEDGASDDDAAEDGAAGDDASEDGAAEDGVSEDDAAEDGARGDDASEDDASTDDAAEDDASAEEADAEEGEGAEEDEEPRSKLGRLVRRGSFISVGSHTTSQLIRFGSNLILTRLLMQEVFGLMALMHVVLIGLHLFSDVGIGPAIVQNEKGEDPKFLHTAFTVQVGRGVLLWLICCAVAYPFSLFYEEPELVTLLPVLGFTTVLSGLQSTKYWVYQRKLRLGPTAILELGTQVVSVVTMIVLAWIYRSVWALVIASLISDALKTLLTHVALEGHGDRLRIHKPSLTSMVRFGKWIFISTIVSFCVSQTDRLVFGKLGSLEVLATYSIAVTLAAMPSQALWRLTGTVLLPAYSQIFQAEGTIPSKDFLRVRGPMMVAAGWVLSGLIGGGGVAIELLYDDRYLDGGWMVQLLSMGAWFMVLDATVAPAILAKGKSQWIAAANTAKLVGMVTLIPLGYWLVGFPGAVAGYAATESFRYLLSLFVAQKEGLAPFKSDMQETAMVAMASAVGYGAALGVGYLVDLVVLEAAAVFLAVTAVYYPRARPAIRRFKEERARRAAAAAAAS